MSCCFLEKNIVHLRMYWTTRIGWLMLWCRRSQLKRWSFFNEIFMQVSKTEIYNPCPRRGCRNGTEWKEGSKKMRERSIFCLMFLWLLSHFWKVFYWHFSFCSWGSRNGKKERKRRERKGEERKLKTMQMISRIRTKDDTNVSTRTAPAPHRKAPVRTRRCSVRCPVLIS